MHYAPALLALAGLAAAYRIPPLTTTEWCLAKCNDVGGDSCVAACVGYPNLSAEQIHAAHECEFKCHIPSKGAEADLACLRACHKRYYYATTSTKAATSATTSGNLARRSDLAASTTMFSITVTGPSGSTNTIISPFVSPKEACHASCPSGDWLCEAACIQVPSPYPGTKVAAIRGCQVACQEIIFNPKDHFNKYASCLLTCFDSCYDPSTGTKVNPLPLSSADIGVSPRSIQAAADATTTTTFSTTTITPAMSTYTSSIPVGSPKDGCFASCKPGDSACQVSCLVYLMPYPGGSVAAAYGECEAACQQLIDMEEDTENYHACVRICGASYYYPDADDEFEDAQEGTSDFVAPRSTSTTAATNAGLGPRTPLAAASPTRTSTSAMSPATHTPSPRENCMASCARDDDCAIECLNDEDLFPDFHGTVTADHECVDACNWITRGVEEFRACLMFCADSWQKAGNSTKHSGTKAATNAGLGPRATLNPAAITPQLAQRSLVPATIIYSDASPKEVCLAECSPQDIACKARCVGVPNPSPAQIAATNKCEAACSQGNGTAAETQFYAACLQKCVDSFYFSGTGTIAAGITATSNSLPAGWSAKTTTMTSTTMIWPSVTLSTKSEIMFWLPAKTGSSTSSSEAGSATGSVASSSATGGPASSGSAPKLGQAGGLFGLMVAMLAL
ncbi:hypothetical protein LTS10_008002 [Elasticomyces elasticus]|nr:hypothetical protein LTS10_008002 [Elasticomyces elasticus]